ncbi:hypothetical protein DSO57_1009429 [Entomophthora muscae]|uniref:Uncharacterized protein n=1 Tax=Entomophthora muscae TaxID=34485 RepID=A0ACC2SVN2_9FUNG|nr:hypothetical protein DSO57_1009429 [Entomophthora muscae]
MNGTSMYQVGYGLQNSCAYSATSCIDKESACCIPDMGRMTLAVQWVVNQPIQKFTLHGFWPGDCETGMGPEDGCKIGETKTEDDLIADAPLKAKMEKYWVSSRNNSQWFWDHEWNKHGTCLSTIREECNHSKGDKPHIRYFKTALREYERYDVYEELARNRIVPREEPYSLKEMVYALNKWRLSFKLQCTRGRLNQIFFFSYGITGNQFIERSYYGIHDCPQKIKYLPKISISPYRAATE